MDADTARDLILTDFRNRGLTVIETSSPAIVDFEWQGKRGQFHVDNLAIRFAQLMDRHRRDLLDMTWKALTEPPPSGGATPKY